VTLGQKLLIMEAMKMENNVLAEKPGIVQKVLVKTGDTMLMANCSVSLNKAWLRSSLSTARLVFL
ncbi:MAG: biotin/lipoyl-containing protein, partial [Chloroflexota bacterium]